MVRGRAFEAAGRDCHEARRDAHRLPQDRRDATGRRAGGTDLRWQSVEGLAAVRGSPMNVAAPIQRPAYTTTKGVDYAQWIAENESDLQDWYRMTSEWEPAQHPADYADFVACQVDIACSLDSALHDGLYEAALRDADNDDEPWED